MPPIHQIETFLQHIPQHLLDIVFELRNIASTLSIVVHTAYRLGEIRQSLCTLK